MKISWLNDQLTEATVQRKNWRGVELWSHVVKVCFDPYEPNQWAFKASGNRVRGWFGFRLRVAEERMRARWAKEKRAREREVEWIRMDGLPRARLLK